jgi:hypothetical protein
MFSLFQTLTAECVSCGDRWYPYYATKEVGRDDKAQMFNLGVYGSC